MSGKPPPDDDNNNFNRYSRGDMSNETTRHLAAATQINLSYARAVRRRIISDPFHALAPTYGHDPVVIARWALSALRRRFWCDVGLTVLFVAGITLLGARLAAGRPGDGPFLVLAIVLLAAALGVVIADEFQTRNVLVTHMRREVFNPADAPEPRKQKVCDRLAEVAKRKDGNLVIFPEDSLFVGSGKLEHQWHLVLDVSHKAKPGDGREPEEFRSAELHAEIIEALGHMDIRSNVAERLFIDGRYIQGHRNLVPRWKPPGTPPAFVTPSVLRQAARNPAPDARVYICAEMPGWQGQLVTTMFTRTVHAGGSLDIEWSFHVLPPLSRLRPDIDKLYAESTTEKLAAASWRGVLVAVPEFLMAPFALAKYGAHRIRARAHHKIQAREIMHGQVFDYGARPSIREEACGFGTPDHFIKHDKIMAIMLAQETLLQTVRDFLVRKHVDVTEFDGEAQLVTYATERNYNVSNLPRTGIVIGDKSTHD